MAFTSVFPCQNTPSRCHFNLTALTNVRSPIYRRDLQIPRGTEVVPEPIFGTRNAGKCIINHRRRPEITPPAVAANSESSFEILSLSDVVKKFYRCINEGDRKGLEDLISSNCRLEDSAFPYIIQGKKEVMSLFIQLADSMGETVQFKLGTICEGDELTASVNWHLEWKNDQIPFSRGCSIFQCSNEDGRLVIMNAQIITESPIKPAKLAMTLLKMVTSLINEFPDAAKWILKSSHTILKAVLNIYNLFLAPVVNPVLTFYITLWRIVAGTLGYAISFLHIIARFFNKHSSSNDNNKDTSNLESEQGPSNLP